MIRTVAGDIAACEGLALVHEHLRIDLTHRLAAIVIGAEDEADVVADLRQAAAAHGLRLVVDLSVVGSGRDALALRRVDSGSGVAVVCSTGFYWDPLPEEARQASVEKLRDAMVRDIEAGIDGSGIRCGVIKIGTDASPPTQAVERLFRAAALAARATGAPVITHTTRPDQAEWQMDILVACGVGF